MRKVVLFDEFAYCCPFFNLNADANNGYGCKHEKQEDAEVIGEKEYGCCHSYSCPLGVEPDAEDLTNPNVDWDGLCEDGEIEDGEYLSVECGEGATDEQKTALENYEKYLNRYQK